MLHAFVMKYFEVRSELGRSRVTQEDFCEDLRNRCSKKQNTPSHKNLTTAINFSDEYCSALCAYFEEKFALNEIPRQRVEAILEAVLETKGKSPKLPSRDKKNGTDAAAIARAVGGWILPENVDPDFVKKCTNDWGNFLLLRMPEPSHFVASEMAVRFDPELSIFPTFETTKYQSGKIDKVVRGCIFKSGRGVYAISRLDQDEMLRVSSLSYRIRTDRTDLFGVRTGILKQNQRYYSHLIYLYQLSDEKREKMMALRNIDDPREKFSLVSEILHENIDRITAALTPDKVPEEQGSPIFQYGFQPISP